MLREGVPKHLGSLRCHFLQSLDADSFSIYQRIEQVMEDMFVLMVPLIQAA